MQGKVKFFLFAKGWGFITGDDGKDYFAHFSQITFNHKPNFRYLSPQDRVTFTIGSYPQGKQKNYAYNIRRI